jgi:hypothetical protein
METLQALTRLVSRSLLASTRRGDGEPTVGVLYDLITSMDTEVPQPKLKENRK